MRRIVLSLADQSVELRYPRKAAAGIEFICPRIGPIAAFARSQITVRELDGLYSIAGDGADEVTGILQDELPAAVMEAALRALIQNQGDAVALHAGGVTYNGNAALIAGPTGAGKSSLIAWLVAKGFGYLSDELTLLSTDQNASVLGFRRPLFLKGEAVATIVDFPAFSKTSRVKHAGGVILGCIQHDDEEDHYPCSAILFPEFVAGTELKITPLTPAQAAFRLVGTNLNARNLPDAGFHALARLSRLAPAVTVRYGDFEDVEGVVDTLLRMLLGGGIDLSAGRRFLSAFAVPSPADAAASAPAANEKREIPAATPRQEPRKLTIGMATYDDYDGVYFSLQALRLYHPEILQQTNFLVIDNHPDGPCAKPLKELENSIANYRYMPFNAYSGTATRDYVFSEADGQFVLCMDCHVFVVPGALKKLLDYLDANPDTPDLLQGPLLYDDLSNIATHFAPLWLGGMFGHWDKDPRGEDPESPPFDIAMHGLGLFACRRTAWPGFNPKFRGFGGEEGYIHEKFRSKGSRVLCLPFLRWMHRFHRPLGVPYVNRWEDRIRNYVIGFRELGMPLEDMKKHFCELLGEGAIDAIDREIAAS